MVGFILAQFHGKDVNRRGLNTWGSRDFRIVPNMRSLGLFGRMFCLFSLVQV